MGLHLLVECQGKDPCPPKKKLEPREDKWCSNVTPVFLAIFTKVVYPCKSRYVTNLHNHWTYWKLGNKGKFLCFPFIQLVERNLPPTPSDQISPEESTGSRVLQPYTWVILGDHMLISIFTVLMNLKFMTCHSYTTSKFFYDTFNQMIQNVLNNHGLATPQRKSKEQNQTLPLKGFRRLLVQPFSAETVASGCRPSHYFIHPCNLLKVWAIEWGQGRVPMDGNMTCWSYMMKHSAYMIYVSKNYTWHKANDKNDFTIHLYDSITSGSAAWILDPEQLENLSLSVARVQNPEFLTKVTYTHVIWPIKECTIVDPDDLPHQSDIYSHTQLTSATCWYSIVRLRSVLGDKDTKINHILHWHQQSLRSQLSTPHKWQFPSIAPGLEHQRHRGSIEKCRCKCTIHGEPDQQKHTICHISCPTKHDKHGGYNSGWEIALVFLVTQNQVQSVPKFNLSTCGPTTPMHSKHWDDPWNWYLQDSSIFLVKGLEVDTPVKW